MRRQILFLLLVSGHLFAVDLTIMPSSHHQLFQTYSLFEEQETGFFFRDHGRAYGMIGATLPIVECTDCKFDPQFILFGNIIAGWRTENSLIQFLTETFDARFGLAFEGQITSNFRMSVGLTHISGHAADSIPDPALIAPNLGDDMLVVRLIYDWDDHARFGFTFKPLINSDPPAKFLAGDQFIEFYPFGTAVNPRHPTFFVSASVEEIGTQTVGVNFHAQTGVFVGSHLQKEHVSVMRLVAGYYTGADPQLKVAQFKNASQSFFYLAWVMSI